jgi:hypothetical protein
LRYSPERPLDYEDKEIAEKLMPEDPRLGKENYSASITTTSGNVRKAIEGVYKKEMEADGLSFPKRKKGERGAWEPIYNWLWNYKFPRWQVDEYWQLLQQKVKDFNFEWMGLVPEGFGMSTDRGMVFQNKRQPQAKSPKKVPAKKPLLMSIDLLDKESYLLLLNRGLNTRYLVCPSWAFAPNSRVVQRPIFLPQAGAWAEEDKIKFDTPGKEEYLAIVLDRPLEVEWLQLNEDDPFPSCEPDRMMELWRQLEGRNDWRVYYEAFEVVEE